ncbi:spore coat protein U domain-containing protein [Marinivivus vitaminiproducens]|uniref:spore coat protein U domain-containing protein n=1 Tax=Marinivivus vitaminiproducens TaxID=3035935 RepID=UPI002799B18B|nr:spore coat protein U domain-containing protein [Geminicoccaceae bacterium SCSIO 64248]
MTPHCQKAPPFRRFTAWAALLSVLAVPAAHAAVTRTGTLAVKVEVVEPPCSVSGATMDFGLYFAGHKTPLRATTKLDVSCPMDVRLSFDPGKNANGKTRGLAGPGGAKMTYELYIGGQDKTPAGDGTRAGSALNVATSRGPTSITLWGTLFGGQDVAPGVYTDTVTVQLTLM